jgi:hypothetical protein
MPGRFGGNYTASGPYELQSAAYPRVRVREYCREEKMSRKGFGEMIGLYDKAGGAVGRFMKEESGVRGAAYPAIVRFFNTYNIQQERKGIEQAKKDLKESKEKNLLAKKELKEQQVLVKKEEKGKKASAKKGEKEKKMLVKKEEKEKKMPVNKEKKESTKRKREEEATVSPRFIIDHSLHHIEMANDDDHAAKGAKVEISGPATVEGLSEVTGSARL